MKKVPFILPDHFLKSYKHRRVDFGPIGEFIQKKHYARIIENEERLEEWWEVCRRVVEGTYTIQKSHCKELHLPWNDNKAQTSARKMFDLMFSFKFLPPGRGLWMMGTDYIWEKQSSAALNNCGYVTTADINRSFSDPFCWLMDMSMLGAGVGTDVRGSGKIKIKQPRISNETLVVEDSREGWVDLIRVILDAFAGKGSIPEKIDYSKVRPAGSKIKGFGGISSGPGPLKLLVNHIVSILNPLIGKDITSTALADIANAIGVCVVSGNIRRSAELLLGPSNDPEFLKLKDPDSNLERLRLWGWVSNNSVLAEIGMDYTELAEQTARSGDIGYVWLDNIRRFSRMGDPPDDKDANVLGCNPCVEQSLESYELCNLVETFPARHETVEEYIETLKYAYLYAKTVTLFPTHDARTNAVMLRNRRIGTSQSGIVQNIGKIGFREHINWSRKGYDYLRQLDKIYSRWLCVPESVKITSIKPSGTVSLLVGATPGIHFPVSETYNRVVRLSKLSPMLDTLIAAGYEHYDIPEENAVAVYFPVRETEFTRSISNVSMWEQLEIAAQMQENWADNQVSVTIYFKKEERDQIKYALSLYETRLKAVSFLPWLSPQEMYDAGFRHSPYSSCTEEEYNQALANLSPVSFSQSYDEDEDREKTFCDTDTCLLK